MEQANPTYAIVIGASAGGFTAVMRLVETIHPETDAAIVIVLHLTKDANGQGLVTRLQKRTSLICLLATDNMALTRAQVYLARPDHHLIITGNTIRLGYGATENRWRPSIDVLFRTAAASFTTRLIGIVLTGMLNDGTSGMSALKRCGGTSIVQDPSEAEFSDMPASVIQNVEVDFEVSLAEMPDLLLKLTSLPPQAPVIPPADIVAETQMELNLVSNISVSQTLGELTPYTCPDCGGVLFKRDEDTITRFKCHTGHSYSLRDLSLKQAEHFESSLWYAIRSLEQKKYLYLSLAEKYLEAGSHHLTHDYKKSEREVEEHIKTLKDVLINNKNLKEPE